MDIITIEYNGTVIEINPKVALSNEAMSVLMTYCFNKTPLPNLTKKQLKQLAIYLMARCEQYSNTHSMRYTIMRDFFKLFLK